MISKNFLWLVVVKISQNSVVIPIQNTSRDYEKGPNVPMKVVLLHSSVTLNVPDVVCIDHHVSLMSLEERSGFSDLLNLRKGTSDLG